MRQITLSILFTVLLFYSAYSQNFQLIKNINNAKSSNVFCLFHDSAGCTHNQFVVAKDVAYFIADDGIHGKELWRSDGTDTGTFMLKDIYPGATTSNITELTVYKDILYFPADDGIHGTELWKSDGTDTGTKMVRDINFGPAPSDPYKIISTSIGLYFAAVTATYGWEVWKSDGTENGTVLLKDVAPGNGNSNPIYLGEVNGKICFFAFDNSADGLWVSDGTPEGTTLLTEVPGVSYDNIASTGKKLFFSIGSGLWVSDATATGTFLVKDFGITTFQDFTVYNSDIYFSASVDPVGSELWKSDGTMEGTVAVKDVTPGVDSIPSITNLAAVGDALYFMGVSSKGNYDLWKTDGTSAHTVKVKGFGSGNLPAPVPYNVNDSLYLSVYTHRQGAELWKSDGTAPGTILVRDIYPGILSSSPSYITYVNGHVLFAAIDQNLGTELWESDGTEIGTHIVRDINTTLDESAQPGLLTVWKSNVYFAAFGKDRGYEFWKTDGSKDGTQMVKDVQPGSAGSLILGNYYMPATKNKIFFPAFTFEYGNEMWSSDGTPTGTSLTKDITAGRTGSNINFYFTPTVDTLGNNVFFTLKNFEGYYDGNNHFGPDVLWKTDGSDTGTQLLYNSQTYISSLISAGKYLYFLDVNYPTSQLYKTDGYSVSNITTASALNSNLFTDGKLVYYTGTNNTLWRTDGTEIGTVQLADVQPNPLNFFDYRTKNYATLKNTLIFTASDNGTYGNEIWQTDGTPQGTVLLKDINPNGSSNPAYFTKVGNIVFFIADDGIHGKELWETNGTASGTRMVKDISTGTSSFYYSLTAVGDKLCFLFSEAGGPLGLWQSDGTAKGTYQIRDAALKNISLQQVQMVSVGDQLFFSASTPKYGTELWKGTIPQTALTADAATPISIKTEVTLIASPNPFKSSVRLQMNADEDGSVQIMVSDMSGKTVTTKVTKLFKGANTVFIDAAAWAAGTYILTVNLPDGSSLTRKVIHE